MKDEEEIRQLLDDIETGRARGYYSDGFISGLEWVLA